MQVQDFASFVASQQDSVPNVRSEPQAGSVQIVEKWLQDLDRLYKEIAGFLDEFLANRSIRIGFGEVTLTEEDIGIYQARRMDIHIGRQHVFLEPVGTSFLACWGRVDVVGSLGRAQLMLVDEKAKSPADLFTVAITIHTRGGALPPLPKPTKSPQLAWKIVSRQPEVTFIDLDKNSFFALLMEVAGA